MRGGGEKKEKTKPMYKCMIRPNSFPVGELLCLQLLLNTSVFNQIYFPVASNMYSFLKWKQPDLFRRWLNHTQKKKFSAFEQNVVCLL